MLKELGVMINGLCNYHCPHCYLGEEDSPTRFSQINRVMKKETVDLLFCEIDRFPEKITNIAVVGMEPFINKESVEILRLLGRGCLERGIIYGSITNGSKLEENFPDDVVFDYLDVSFDGGTETYLDYRGGKFSKVLQGILHTAERGTKKINILNTLSDRNIGNINDMIQGMKKVREIVPQGITMFSPFVQTRHGRNIVKMLPTLEIVQTLSQSSFMEMDPETCYLVLDRYHFLSRGEREENVVDAIQDISNDLCDRVMLCGDPLIDGEILRITIDGLVIHALESLHGELQRRRMLGEDPLSLQWNEVVEQNEKIISMFY